MNKFNVTMFLRLVDIFLSLSPTMWRSINLYFLRFILLSTLILCPCKANENATNSKPSLSPTYTIVAPSKIQPNSAYQLSVHWTNTTSPLDVEVKVIGSQHNVSHSLQVTPDETRFVSLNVSQWVPDEYKLEVKGSSETLNFTRERYLTYESPKFIILLQTDKATYKPEQIVKFRAIILKSDLIPVSNVTVDIFIKDSNENLIKKWKNVSLEKGLTSRELQLSEQPPLGDWSIRVQIPDGQTYVKKFIVAEYVLPTFSVDVQLPKYITINDTDVTATVKARYTYGKPVNGEVTLTAQIFLGGLPLDYTVFQTKAKLSDSSGSVDIPINTFSDLSFDDMDRANLPENTELVVHASVEEQLTGRVYNRTEKTEMFESAIKVEAINPAEYFKPGLPFTVFFKVAYRDDTPVEDDGMEVSIIYGFSYSTTSWKNRIWSKNGTIKQVPSKGLIRVDFYPPKDSPILGWRAEYRGKEYAPEQIYPTSSPSDSFIEVTIKNGPTESRNLPPQSQFFQVGQNVTFQINCTEPIEYLTYQVQSKGATVLIDTVKLADPLLTFEFSIKITNQMAPNARLLVYYIRPANREIITDSINIKIDDDGGLFKTPVHLSSNVNQTKPGGRVDITVRTNPEAMVGLLSIDQSVLLLQSGNDITRGLVRQEVETHNGESQVKEKYVYTDSWTYNIVEKAGFMIFSNGLIPGEPDEDDYDDDEPTQEEIDAVRKALAARPKISRPAYSAGPTEMVAANAAPVATQRSKSVPIRLRKSFPETWIWTNVSAGSDGIVSYSDRIPDTITSWYISAFAIDSNTGLGVAENNLQINVFRPFFVKLSLPYSIIRGESVSIQALVFNYQSKPIQAEVIMENAKNEFDFINSDNEVEDIRLKRKTTTVPALDGVSLNFMITPKMLGNIDIKIRAKADNAGDAVVRKLLVKPEGQTQYFNKAQFIKIDDNQTNSTRYNFSVEIPPNAVPGSMRVKVSGISDILGPTVNNIDNLLRMPYGCGEQNMINFVPNIVVLNYLTKTKRLTRAIKSKALRHIEKGYQRELTYLRKDGSFSAFGNSDAEGSTWLTAFVVKSFIQARPYIDLDESVISKAIEFLFSRQNANGSFVEKGSLFDKKMQGGASASGTLTAYVLSAILHEKRSNLGAHKVDIKKAQDFILSRLSRTTNPYEIAIISYALHLSDSTKKKKNSAFKKLMSLVKRENGRMYWTHESEKTVNNLESAPIVSEYLKLPDAFGVESSAYGLLTLMARSNLDDGIPALKWLISKQNSNGGFASTQDTVIGLQALGAIAERISSPALNMSVSIKYSKKSNNKSRSLQSIQFNPDNALVFQQRELGSEPRWIELKASGIGSALVQVSYQYNIAEGAEKPAFILKPQISNASTDNYLQLNICTSYKDGNSTNMALMEVELPSGFNADVDTLRTATHAKEVKRVDPANNDGTVFIYFDQVTTNEVCVTVPAHRIHHVANLKPVPVTIFDYYDRSKLSRTFYSPATFTTNEIIAQSESLESTPSPN